MPVSVPSEVSSNLQSREMDAPLYLLHIYDTSNADAALRLVSDYTAITGPDGQTYQPFPFKATPPTQTGDETPVIRVEAADINMAIVDDIVRSAGTRDEIEANVYVVQRGVTTPDGRGHVPIVSYRGFQMVNAVNDRTSLQFDLTPRNYLDAPLGKYWFGPGDFPGLF